MSLYIISKLDLLLLNKGMANFLNQKKLKVFISQQAYEGLKILVNSIARDSFFFNTKSDAFHAFHLKDSVKTSLKIIFEENFHLDAVTLTYH